MVAVLIIDTHRDERGFLRAGQLRETSDQALVKVTDATAVRHVLGEARSTRQVFEVRIKANVDVHRRFSLNRRIRAGKADDNWRRSKGALAPPEHRSPTGSN